MSAKIDDVLETLERLQRSKETLAQCERDLGIGACPLTEKEVDAAKESFKAALNSYIDGRIARYSGEAK
jgi:hypothetical protein